MSSILMPGDPEYNLYRNDTIVKKADHQLLDILAVPKGKDGFWGSVELFMDHLYNHKNPAMRDAIKLLEQDCKDERAQKRNKWASNDDKSIRKVGVVPDKLYLFLQRLYDHDLPVSEEQFKKGFFRRYPQFLITEKL